MPSQNYFSSQAWHDAELRAFREHLSAIPTDHPMFKRLADVLARMIGARV